jgi:hypothetical protein
LGCRQGELVFAASTDQGSKRCFARNWAIISTSGVCFSQTFIRVKMELQAAH